MPKFLKFASITKKITLALIGLFLMLFLLMHLGINLCMLRNDGGEWFRAAAHFMGTNYIVKFFEVVLFSAFLLHIALALTIQIHNWRARPIGYAKCSKSKTSAGSKFMIWTGILIAIFLGVHFVHFFFVKIDLVEGRYIAKLDSTFQTIIEKNEQAFRMAYHEAKTDEERIKIGEKITAFQDLLMRLYENEKFVDAFFNNNLNVATNLAKSEVNELRKISEIETEPDFYEMAKIIFKMELVVLMYLAFLIALCFHLMHGFKSAFQTLGLAHSKYSPIIKIVGIGYAALISAGFAVIPLFFYFYK